MSVPIFYAGHSKRGCPILKKANAKKDYTKTAKQIDRLRDEKQRLLLEDANKEGARRNLVDIEAFFEEQTGEITEFDEAMARRLIEKIDVYDDRLKVTFKSGLETEVSV